MNIFTLRFFIFFNGLFLSPGFYSQLNFTVSNPGGNYSITCTNLVVNLFAASNYTNSPVSYSWVSTQMPAIVANSLAITNPGMYTITATAGSLTSSQAVAVGINTIAPGFTLTSSRNAFTCGVYDIVLNASSGTQDLSYSWVTPFSCAASNTCLVHMPGTFTCTAMDSSNGCVSSKTINIADNRIYPTITVTDAYTINCPNGTANVNPVVSGGNLLNMQYTWFTSTGAILSATNAAMLVLNAPGIYYLSVVDTSNSCTSFAQINVSACVGINENDKTLTAIQIFPNPVKDKLHFEFDKTLSLKWNLSISNTLGQIVYSRENTDLKEDFDVGGLKTAVYYARLQGIDGQKVFKIMKE